MAQREAFYHEYRKQLHIAAETDADYAYLRTLPIGIDGVADKMIAAIERRSYNKDGEAFRATCRAFGIPHTYKAINAFIEA